MALGRRQKKDNSNRHVKYRYEYCTSYEYLRWPKNQNMKVEKEKSEDGARSLFRLHTQNLSLGAHGPSPAVHLSAAIPQQQQCCSQDLCQHSRRRGGCFLVIDAAATAAAAAGCRARLVRPARQSCPQMPASGQ